MVLLQWVTFYFVPFHTHTHPMCLLNTIIVFGGGVGWGVSGAPALDTFCLKTGLRPPLAEI